MIFSHEKQKNSPRVQVAHAVWWNCIANIHLFFLSLSLPPLSLSPSPISMNDCFRCNKGLHPGIEWQILTKGIFSRSFHPSVKRVYTPHDIIRATSSNLDPRLASGLFITIARRERRNCNCTLERFDKSTTFLSRERKGSERDRRRILRDRFESREMEGEKRRVEEGEGKRNAQSKIRSRVKEGDEGITVQIVKNGARTKEGRKEERGR